MKPFLPQRPEPPEPDEDGNDLDEYQDQRRPRRPARYNDQAALAAEREYWQTQPRSGRPSNPGRLSQPANWQEDIDFADDKIDLQQFSNIPSSRRSARPPARAQSMGRSVQQRRRSAKRAPVWLSPWLVRVALLAVLIALGIRSGLASASFMSPGGDIVDWSRLPAVPCAFCHLPHPTATHQQLTPEQYAATLLTQLNLDQKLGQMLIVQMAGTQVTPDVVQMLSSQGAGGIILYEYNISSASQIESLNAQLKQLSSVPLMTVTDQEGGYVNRLEHLVGPLPAAASLTTPQAADAAGAHTAELLTQFGFNFDLAPVVDVGTANPQLYDRTFGSDPDTVAALAGAYLHGLQQSGTITGTLKHFPGLGSTTVDPHLGLPTLVRTKADWESIDLEPYRVLLKSEDVRAIMVTHEMVPVVDSTYPASVSRPLITGVLRGELGYTRVIITDSLLMGGVNRWTVPQAAVLAIEAGADMVIGPSDPQGAQQVIDALKAARTSGALSQATIDAAVTRILALKIRMGLIPLPNH